MESIFSVTPGGTIHLSFAHLRPLIANSFGFYLANAHENDASGNESSAG